MSDEQPGMSDEQPEIAGEGLDTGDEQPEMTDQKQRREIEAREAAARSAARFSAGPKAHSVGLTEERVAQIVRQSANARNAVFLAVLLIALFIPVYWFYETGLPAVGAEGRLEHEARTQYVQDVARGYDLYLANCARCHGEEGRGGIGPPLNDQAKLYNVLTADGQPGSGHLNPDFLDNVLTVGGRYICGDPDSLMAVWREPGGPLNYRQIEELIAWLTASSDTEFKYEPESHGEAADEEHAEPVLVRGWRDPTWEPEPGATPPPACWRAPAGLTAVTAADETPTTGEAIVPGTPEDPRVIKVEATGDIKFKDESGTVLQGLEFVEGETVVFEVDNTAGFEHNFYIGPQEVVSQPSATTEVGIAEWEEGVQTLEWVATGGEGLEFACTVPGHYASGMRGAIVISDGGGPAAGVEEPATEAEDPLVAEQPAAEEESTTEEPAAAAAALGTPENPRVVKLEATADLKFKDETGTPLGDLTFTEGETVVFEVDNTAGFPHNFYIGSQGVVSQHDATTEVGIADWPEGVQTVEWVATASEDLEYACTVPGHYVGGMRGAITVTE
jgi:uncharacterized cupredoxin-like copper-binding protein/mono/diheme cytochrome c family protein